MSDSTKLTPNQKAAITTLDKSVSVSAGAGSGKTEVLVRRFRHIVESGRAAVDEILTVTFTEKAAKEMKARIVERFAAVERESDRRAVESAYISTIHGFCARVLRENAIEAGVDPQFTVLDEAESRTIANQALDALIEAHQDDDDVIALIQHVELDKMRSAILSFYGQIRSLGCALSDELISEVNPPEPFLETFNRCILQLTAQSESASDALAKVIDGITSGLAQAGSDMKRLANSPSLDWESLKRLRDFHKLFPANAGSKEAKQWIKSAREALADFLAACLDRESHRNSSIFLRLIASYDTYYSEAKAQLGMLDYSDMLTKTRNLFMTDDGSPSEVAYRYRDKFAFIALDEFQDTNRLQKQIVDAVSRPNNVFTVGDVKQSIYSFMYSDIDVFQAHHDNAKADQSKWAVIPFQENFRSRDGILGFVNRFFDELWGEKFEFEFEHLKCGGKFTAQAEPNIEVMLAPKSGKAEQGRMNEALSIAQRIVELTDAENPARHTKGDKAGQPITPGDIVILLRSTTNLHIYERALEEYGIDTYVVSGRGFYSTREVQDIVSLLKVIDNPLSDVAMAAVLRSPIVGVSDDALFWLCRDWTSPTDNRVPPLNEITGKLWEGLSFVRDIPHLTRDDASKLTAFRDMLNELLGIRSQPRITDILDLVLERSLFDVRLLSMRGGRRKYSNIRKFYEVAQDFQSSNLFGLTDFIAYVQELERLAEKESEAAIESESGNVVRIMTIHKAKGLQAPVVFVADTSRKLGGKSGFFVFDSEYGLAAQAANPWTSESEIPLCHREIGERLKEKGISEEKRILYVAMTRAEERLILTGSSDLKGKPKSTYSEMFNWSGWMEKALGIGPESTEGEISFGGMKVTFRRSLPADAPLPVKNELPTLARRFAPEFLSGRQITGIDIPSNTLQSAGVSIDRCLSEEAAPETRLSRLSVSQALDYLECPAKYRLAHIIGIPEEAVEGQTTGAGISAADIGHKVHFLLSIIDFSADVDAQIQSFINKMADDPERQKIEPALRAFASSEWCRNLAAADQIIRETPFEIMIDGTLIAGRMDVIYHDADGWTILDYKTGRAEDKDRYELQVGIYAYVAHRLLGEMPARAVLQLLSSSDDDWVSDTRDGAIAQLAAEKVGRVVDHICADRFEPKPGTYCQWCSFDERCGKDKSPY